VGRGCHDTFRAANDAQRPGGTIRRMILGAFLIALATPAAPPASGASTTGQLVVILPLAGSADAATREAFTDALRKGASALAGFGVQGKSVTAQHLVTASTLGLSCPLDRADCVLKLGGLAGAAIVIGGTLAPGPDGRPLASLRAFEVSRTRERSSSSLAIPADLKGQTAAARLLAVRLLAPERERGLIEVAVKQKGATILVDGVPRGVSPLTKPLEVAPGKHEVYVALIGFESAVHEVSVAFEQSARLEVELRAGAGGPPLPTVQLDDPAAPAPPPPAPPAEATPKKGFVRVAVYELEASGVEPRIARIVTEAILAELRKLEGTSVVGMDEIRAMLDYEANRQLVGCEADASCLAEIAGALGADIVVIGSLARVGDESIFGVRRLDQKSAQVTAQATERLKPADGEEFLAAVGIIVEKAFPELPLRQGAERGAPAELALRMRPPPLQPWTFWMTAATAGALGAGTVGAGVVNLLAFDSYSSQARPPNGGVASGPALKQTETLIGASAWAFWGGLAATAVVGAAAGVEALFTDWWGYGDEGPPAGG
jgi:hypothetical protein